MPFEADGSSGTNTALLLQFLLHYRRLSSGRLQFNYLRFLSGEARPYASPVFLRRGVRRKQVPWNKGFMEGEAG
jgi:hypothetical protein